MYYAVPTAGINMYNNTNSFATEDIIPGYQGQLISAVMLVLCIAYRNQQFVVWP